MKSIRLLAIFTGLCATMIAEEIRELFDAYWEFEMQSDPFSATSSGVDSYNHAVPDASAEARRARVERLREFRERLEQFDESSLSSSDRISAQVLDHILRDDIALAAFEGQVVEDVEEHPYFRPFTKMPESIPDSVADALVEEGRRTISDKLMPAAKSLARFMQRLLRNC